MLAAEALGSAIETLDEPITAGLDLEAETFALASNPGANHTIFLDFDGHFTSGTDWESPGSFATPAYDTDGEDTAFTDEELLEIQEIYLRVAENFAPFNVNVTTIDPGTDELTRSDAFDQTWGVRVVLGGKQYDWHVETPEFISFDDMGEEEPILPEGDEPAVDLTEEEIALLEQPTIIGASIVGSFNDSHDTPVYVFTNTREPVVIRTVEEVTTDPVDPMDPMDPPDPPMTSDELVISEIQFVPAFRDSEPFLSPADDDPERMITRTFSTPQAVAAIASREIGHAMGLEGDGVEGDPDFDPDMPDEGLRPPQRYYYPAGYDDANAQPDPLPGSAPIMADARNAKLTHWNTGTYSGANNDEDDLEIITTQNGFGYRPDDAGDFGFNFITGELDFDEATVIDRGARPPADPFFNAAFLQDGIIEQDGETDFYVFTTAQGPLNLLVLPGAVKPIDDTGVDPNNRPTFDIPETVGPNLNVSVTLYNEDSEVVASGASLSEEEDTLARQISVDLEQGGNYYLVIGNRPVGQMGTYGSIGQYTIRIDGDLLAGPDPWDLNGGNDFFSTATVLSSADYFLPRGTIHLPGDEDYYRWTAGENGLLDVSLDFEQQFGDLDMRLLDSNGSLLTTSASVTDDEAILDYPVVAGEDYVIQVFGAGGTTQFQYDLLIDGPGYLPDEFDVFGTSRDMFEAIGTYATADTPFDPKANPPVPPPENYLGGLNDTAAMPAVFGPAGQAASDYTITDLSIHVPGDDDYYLWESQGTGTMTTDLFFDHDEVNIRLTLIDPDTMLVLDSVNSADDNEHLEIEVVDGQQVLIHVTGSVSTMIPGDGRYDLTIDGPDIDEDRFEPNDTFTEAYNRVFGPDADPDDPDSIDLTDQLPLNGFFPNNILSIHNTADFDYFFFTPERTGDFRVRSFFIHALGDLDMRLNRVVSTEMVGEEVVPTLEVVAASTSLTDNETILERVFKDETYLVEVFGFEQATLGAYRFDAAFAPINVDGDYDLNGFVGDEDRALWASFYGATVAGTPEAGAVDGNNDGVINAADYAYWRDRQGDGVQPPASISFAMAPKVAPTPIVASASAPVVARVTEEPLLAPSIDLAAAEEDDASPVAAAIVSTDRSAELALLLVSPTEGGADEESIELDSAEEEEPLDDAFAAFGLNLSL